MGFRSAKLFSLKLNILYYLVANVCVLRVNKALNYLPEFLFRPIKKIWHGSHADGTLHRSGYQCRNWQSETSTKKGTAASITTYTPALNEEPVRCNKKLIVLCIQTSLRS